MRSRGPWRSGEVGGWTGRDGVGSPPRGPGRVAPGLLAGTLAVVLTGMTSYDTLCAQHRTWIVSLSVVGILGTVAAIAGLVQARALAPLFIVLVALSGVSIGLIDAVHDPTRGRLVALGFGFAAGLGVLLTARAVPMALWERHVLRRLAAAEAAAVPDGAPTRSGRT